MYHNRTWIIQSQRKQRKNSKYPKIQMMHNVSKKEDIKKKKKFNSTIKDFKYKLYLGILFLFFTKSNLLY